MPELMCNVGKALYLEWGRLLDQRRPKANPKIIREAMLAYFRHCQSCLTCKKRAV